MSWSPGPDVEIRVVTEDGSPAAHETVSHLLRRMLQLVEPAFATNRLRALRHADAEEGQAAQPHRWHSKNERDRLLVKRLARTIATDLLASRFVLMHADADVKWSERPSGYEASFRDNFVPVVRAGLLPARAEPRSPRRTAPAPETRSEEEIRRCLGRLVLIMPYWTIEAWLYQNTDVALRLCREKYQGGDIQKFLSWQNDRARLDNEEAAALEQVCLGKHHNLDLASSGYPARDVYEARASFHAAVEALRGCAGLLAALSLPPAGSEP